MANFGVFMGWNRPVPGREGLAAELFAETMKYYTRLQKDGTIESFEPVLLARHGGDLNGFVLVRGDREKIARWMATPEYNDLVMRVDHALQGFGQITCHVGEGVNEQMSLWQRLITK